MRYTGTKYRTMYYNRPQLINKFCSRPNKTNIWGRGTGKSTLNGDDAELKVHAMPRSRGFIVGSTYMQLLTLELPPIKAQWERLGYVEDVHYFIGKKPPPQWKHKWPKAFHMPSELKNVIWWYNGSIIQLVSFDRKDSARGGSFDWGLGIEAAMLSKTRLDNELLPAVRGTDYSFNKHPLHKSITYTSSMPWTSYGDWLFEAEEVQEQEEKEILGADLYNSWLELKNDHGNISPLRKKIIRKLKVKASERTTLYLEANAYDNIHILGEDWIDVQRARMHKESFDIEIMNIRKKKLGKMFYPKFKDRLHTYQDSYDYHHLDAVGEDTERLMNDCRNDGDLISGVHLQASFDFNGGIYTCVVFQEIKSLHKVRFLKSFFVKEEKGLNDLVKEVTEYYFPHRRKFLEVWGDRNGHFASKISIASYYEEVASTLKMEGWKFSIKAPDFNIPHTDRFLYINKMLSFEDPSLPEIEINANNCKPFIISIKNAPLKKGHLIEKDKSSEASDDILQEYATHFSDCFDYALQQYFYRNINSSITSNLSIGI
ncbi:hypothetical protein [Flammeovirga pacifica]|uniref:Uncharacterized protein n=1 Tax=Flammeovirga pacifica TaxID=915059 RepID=A0A1S1Z274_FLAPC|nr:hypothetical protein [Flammeovirga pacifica]OHX67370.1 hypothetical protein NH26_13965 [Flammeovirga pacifica]